MSNIVLGNFNWPNANRSTLVCVLGDALDLTPKDVRVAPSYAVTTKPGGSSASFTSAVCTPDVVGQYAFSVTQGSDVLSVPFFCFATTNVYTPLNTKYGDAQARAILLAVAQGALTNTQMTAWNTGTYPAISLTPFGG